MTLGDLFQRLSYGELQNLSAYGTGNGTITDAKRPVLTNYVNEALLKLYSRFILRENDLLLALSGSVTLYHLVPQYAVSYIPTGPSDTQAVRYILDRPEVPFQDTIIKILSINDQYGHFVPLNDEESPFSVFTPHGKALQVPSPCDGKILNVRYQERHPVLQGDLSEQIKCPEVLVSALASYVAYQTFDHMNSTDGVNKGQGFLAKFENACGEILDRDLVNSSTSQSNTRFDRGGWI